MLIYQSEELSIISYKIEFRIKKKINVLSYLKKIKQQATVKNVWVSYIMKY